MIILKSDEEIEVMRESCQLASRVLDMIGEHVVPGVSTLALNDICHEYIVKHDAIPAPLNYRGFPKSICTSVNHCICHGVPDDTPLKDGDIVNVDVTSYKFGFHGDTSIGAGGKARVRVSV